MWDDPCVVATRDLLHYRVAPAFLIFRFLWLLTAARRGKRNLASPKRPAWDATWFLPVYVGGVESLLHLTWWSGGIAVRGIIPPGICLLEHGALSGLVLLGLLAACIIQEWTAPRVGIAARASVGALPLPVVAALAGVAATWTLSVTALYVSLR